MRPVLATFIIYVLLLSGGCTSSPINENYYVLGASEAILAYPASASKTVVTLQTVELAEFLRQPHLIMQIGEHQIQKANYHFWAEQLQDAITRELLYELRTQSKTFHFESSAGRYTGITPLTLYVTLNQFHPSDRSEVTVAGQYWLIDKSKKQTIASNDFLIAARLEKDGYTHAVEQLRTLLVALSKSILVTIE